MQQSCGLFRRIVALAVAAAVLAAAWVSAAQPSPPAKSPGERSLKSSVERLLGDLDSRSRSVRIRAERELLALGPRILPLLPPPELTANVSVREAVRRVRIRLESTAARESIKPSRVTLKGSRSLNEILPELAKQTGNLFDATKLPKSASAAKFEVSYAGTTFWAVIDDLARRRKLRFRVLPGENRIAVDRRPAGAALPVAVDNRSAFRIAVLSLQPRPIAGDDAKRLLRVRWSITAEPRLRPLFLKYAGRSLIAETAAGKPLAPFAPDATLEVAAVDGAAPISQTSDFILPKGTAAAAIRFRGQVRMLTAAASEPIEFRDLSRARGSSKRRGGVTVTVNSATKGTVKKKGAAASERVTVDVSISYDAGGPAFESHRTWIFHNRVYLETAAGTRIAADPAFKTIVQRDGAVGVAYSFTAAKLPLMNLTFVYVAPTLLVDVPVEFDFRKLPLTPNKPARSSR